jgi:hypothetical protein
VPNMQPLSVATILPTAHLDLDDSDYHMCLAHLLGDQRYSDWFAARAAEGHHVLMDNGAAEAGIPMEAERLFELATRIGATEMTLPDVIRDSAKTRRLHLAASDLAESYNVRLMGVPQGRTQQEWASCARFMVDCADLLGIGAIGVSKFQYGVWRDRAEAILAVPGLLDSGLEIHLLGCWGADPTEAHRTAAALPDGLVRGIDSGIAAIYAQEGRALLLDGSDRSNDPGHNLDFSRELSGRGLKMLELNIQIWRRAVAGRRA